MTSDLDSCNSVSINAVFKAIPWYSTPHNLARTKLLQKKLISYAKHTDIKELIHVGQLGYNLQPFNYCVFSIIMRRLLENLERSS